LFLSFARQQEGQSVSSGFHDDAKEQVRQSVDIVELIGQHVQLQRRGRNFLGLCPWHEDTRPSLQVNPDRQSWKCWVCDIGGDVFSYAMRREGIEFREALELLAELAGITLPRRGKMAEPGSPDDKQALFQAMTWAEAAYHDYLVSSKEAQLARDYLAERQITPESIADYGIGFAPNEWQWLADRAEREGQSAEILKAIGVLGTSEKGRVYDIFRGRVLFPIRDPSKRPIAFGGRILPAYTEEKTAKYINSPETRIFTKSKNVYGLDVARNHVSAEVPVLVMEGYTDVLIAHQQGFGNSVAVLGTALGEDHIRLLRRFVDNIVLVLDGDAAGQRRASEVLDLFIAAQVELRVLILPENMDPCDFLLQQGPDAFQQRIDAAADALEYKVQVAIGDIDLANDTHHANQALESILASLARAPVPRASTPQAFRLRQQQVISRLARLFSVPEIDLRGRLNELRSTRAEPVEEESGAAERHYPPLTPVETELFEILVGHPELVSAALSEIPDEKLETFTARQLLSIYQNARQRGEEVGFSNILTKIDDPSLKLVLVELDESSYNKASSVQEDARQRLAGLVAGFRNQEIQQENRRSLDRLASEQLPAEEEIDVLEQLLEKERLRQGISSPKDG
jgi:DNA primase